MNNIPEGWKLVPVEPTDEMATAAMNAAIHANSVYGETAAFSDIWRAMLSAAPAVQGEPDVAGLVGALEQCITSMLDSGYRADAVVIRAARSALAAYHKGSES